MNVSLTPALEEMIHKKVESGAYASASEVVREALRRLKQYDAQLEQLRMEADIGLAQLERGEFSEYTPGTMNQLMEQAMARMKKGHVVKDAIKP